MTCAWKELLDVLPAWIRQDLDDKYGACLQELRLRINSPPELVCMDEVRWMNRNVVQDDLNYIINTASRYSPWAAASASQGYITVTGGHRIGICGDTIVKQGIVTGFSKISSVCIRVARDFSGIAAGMEKINGSILILGSPGWGKTTLLRDLIRQLETSERICVVDERGELFPSGLNRGKRIDVLNGCSKVVAVPMLVRTMGASCIAVDEITDLQDSMALLRAANCGVRLLATAHGTSVSDFQHRSVYRPLFAHNVFDVIIVLRSNRSYTMERMRQWNTNGLVRS